MKRTAIGGTVVFVYTRKSLFYVYSAFSRLNPKERFIAIEVNGGYVIVIGSDNLKIPKRFTTEVYFPSVAFINEGFREGAFYVSLYLSLKDAKEEAREAVGDVYGMRYENGDPVFLVLSKDRTATGINHKATAVLEKTADETLFYDLQTMRVFTVSDGDDEDDGNLSDATGV